MSSQELPGADRVYIWPRMALWPFLRIGELVFFATTRKNEVAIHRLRTEQSDDSKGA